MITTREYLASLPRRREVVRGVLEPIQVGKRDRGIAGDYERLAPGSDGRIHTGLSVATTGGRLASSGSIIEEAATNLQNQPNKVVALDPLYNTRDVMLADPGFRLICLDYASAEGLLVFAYSEDWEWVDKILAGESIHAHHAKEFFNLSCPVDQVKKKYPQMYNTAKNLTFLSFYSGGARMATITFNRDYPIHGLRTTEQEVRRVQKILYQLHPLEAWWEKEKDKLRKNRGAIRNCFNQRRVLRDPDERNRLKDALSFLPQSTVAYLMNVAWWRVHEEVDREGEVELLHQVHDEMDLQSLPEYVEETIDTVTGIMETPFEINGYTLPIPTEVKVGEVGGSWGGVKKWEPTSRAA